MSRDLDKAVITCAVTGVLTDPRQHPVPVTVPQMADAARQAFEAGASILHLHLRDQRPGMGHLPSWDPDLAEQVVRAVREACPGVLTNLSTGVVGPDVSGPSACLRRVRPELAACNAGTLNYLKTRKDGGWAWPPVRKTPVHSRRSSSRPASSQSRRVSKSITSTSAAPSSRKSAP